MITFTLFLLGLMLFLLGLIVGLVVGTVVEHNNTRCPNNKNYRGDS